MKPNFIHKSTFALLLAVILTACSPTAMLTQMTPLQKSKMAEVLERVTATRTSFDGATRAVNEARDHLFDIAATSEKKAQLKSKESELETAASDADKERITIEIQEMKDQEIEAAHQAGRLEGLKLTGEQLLNVGRIARNLKIATLLSQKVLRHSPKIITDGTEALKSPAPTDMLYLPRLQVAITNEIPAIINQAPQHVKTISAFLGAISVLKGGDDALAQETEADIEEIDVKDLDFGTTGF